MAGFQNPIRSLAGSPGSSAGCYARRAVRFYRPKVVRFSLLRTERPARRRSGTEQAGGKRGGGDVERG
jgi:hypothetical protein